MTHLPLSVETISLQAALKEIHFYRGVMPLKAYEVLTKHQQEATPLLLQLLENIIPRHDRTGDYYVAHIHALLLLSQFREKKAYPLVMALLNLPIDSIDRLIGDMFTETIPKIVVSIYDGNPAPLFSLLTNQAVNQYVRNIVGVCFSALIYQRMIAKELVVLRLQEIVASGKMNEDQPFFTTLANITLKCKLEPLYDTVRAACRSGMVCTDTMDVHYFDQQLSRPIEEMISEEDLSPLTDATKELVFWYAHDKPITPKIERNSPCRCGSGLKFKKCCVDYL